MKELRRLATDSVLYGGADILAKCLAIFYFPIIAAYLGLRDFGVLELVLTTTALIGIFVNLGLNGAVSRFYWDAGTTDLSRKKIVSSGLFAQFLCGTIIAVFLFLTLFITPHVNFFTDLPITYVGLTAAIFFCLFSQYSQFVLDVARLHFAPIRFLISSLLSKTLIMAFGILAVVFLQGGVDGLLVAQAVALITVFPCQIFLVKKDFHLRSVDWAWVKKLSLWGYPFIFASLAYVLFGLMDRWMLAAIHSTEEVGVYSVAHRFSSIVLLVSAAFGKAWSPALVKIKSENPHEYRNIFGMVLVCLFYVVSIVAGGMALFSGEVISLLMPVEYYASSFPLLVLCFGLVFQATQQVTLTGISLENKTYLFARLAWLTAAINFIANIILIPNFGASGAAFATTLSYLALTSSFLYFTQKLHPIKIDWLSLLKLVFLSMVIAIISTLLMSYEVDLKVVLVKLLVAFFCMFVGWYFLPIKELRSLKF